MKTLLYLPPFLATRRFDCDAVGSEKFFRKMLHYTGLRRKFLAIEARFPTNLRLNNEFHHTGGLTTNGMKILIRTKINDVYQTVISKDILGGLYALPSALDVNFKLSRMSSLGNVDGVIVSSQCSREDRNLAEKYIDLGTPVFYFDNLDREEFYENPCTAQKIVNGLSNKYRLCFIKDLPLQLELPNNVVPIAPVPVSDRLLEIMEDEVGSMREGSHIKSTANFGFFGRRRPGICRDERQAMLDAAIDVGGVNGIFESDGYATLREIYETMVTSKYLLSPSGRVWCSYRHTELAALRRPILMNQPTCYTFEHFHYPKELFIPSLNSGSSMVHETYQKAVNKKLSNILMDVNAVAHFADSWLEQVKSYHTRNTRAQFYTALMMKYI
jgi:hypothetical protein